MVSPKLHVPQSKQSQSQASQSHPFILTSAQACGTTPPPMASTVATFAVIILLLTMSEQCTRYILFQCKDFHDILENPTNRYILARHLGVDTLSCFICAMLGLRQRTFLQQIYTAVMTKSQPKSNKKKNDDDENDDDGPMPLALAQERGYAYSPGAFFLSIFFVGYQLKNLADTIVWNDGPEYIFHHVLSLMVGWGSGLYPGFCMDQAAFFFGLSEISTGVLCILANFDDDHGVVGLGAAFPLTKVIIGVVFVVFFIVCRVILWPLFSYYFCRDAFACLKIPSPELDKRKTVIRVTVGCLIGLSALQISWLVLIYFIAVKEFQTLGLI